MVALTGAGTRSGDSGKPWRGIDPTTSGRHWAVPNSARREFAHESDTNTMTTQEKLELLDTNGLIYWPKHGSIPRQKRYLDEAPGVKIQDIISDIHPISSQSSERIGYPTQKPLALLERLISASSNPGDIILDPFCGCGTAIVAAEKLGRQWIGIDITFIAIDLMISRLARDFGLRRNLDYTINGDPKDVASARALFQQSPKEFEKWAVGLAHGVPQEKGGGDRGIDGKVYSYDIDSNLRWAVVQVKGGHLSPSLIRDFAHVIEREKAVMGFFITLENPTLGMYQTAEDAGMATAPSGRLFPRLQLRTIRELLHDGHEFDFPQGYSLKSGGKRILRTHEQAALDLLKE